MAEYGRDPSEIGLDGRLKTADASPEDWIEETAAWRTMGASHLSIENRRAGLQDGRRPHRNDAPLQGRGRVLGPSLTMSKFQPRDPGYTDRVTAAFRNESAASRWGGELTFGFNLALWKSQWPTEKTGPRRRERCTAACLLGMLDDACVLAALSLTSPADQVTIAEYKVNYLASAMGEAVVAHAEVVRPGRCITVCRADALANGRLLARMLATLSVSRLPD